LPPPALSFGEDSYKERSKVLSFGEDLGEAKYQDGPQLNYVGARGGWGFSAMHWRYCLNHDL